ncbi:UNVERIFIED_CONTAM: hypothetical protein Sradi_2336000 [Sesamum radiatum]|uniref:Myb/SANT-like domain-containing protein n=1 Tax=Sesamum radiatum TaxID=300843 RepID=A0AAW2T5W5_SESRA
MSVDPLESMLNENISPSDAENTEYIGTVETNTVWNSWRDEIAKPTLKAEPHISSKIHVWKKTYGCINDMMGRSGFGWNPTTNTIDVKDEAFDNFAKIDSFTKTLWFKSFPFYPQWCEVFEKDRATGECCFDLILAPLNSSTTVETERSENVPVTPEYYVPTPDPNLYGDDDEFMNSFASATAPTNMNRSETKRVSLRKRKMVVTDIDEKFDEKFEAFVNVTDRRLGESPIILG